MICLFKRGSHRKASWGALTALLLVVATSFALADQVSVTYTFDRPVFSEAYIEGVNYDRITIMGAPNSGNAGQPLLPAQGARILIPYGTEVASIEIIIKERVSLGDGFLIEPASRPIPFSASMADFKPPQPDPAIYAQSEPFPGIDYENIGTCEFRGYYFVTLKLQPVQYTPATGELSYSPEITVVVNTTESGKVGELFRGVEKDARAVVRKVDNPEIAGSYPVMAGDSKGYDLMIFTTPALASAFEPLKTFHDANGIATQIKTTADAGGSAPATVRNYIVNEYMRDHFDFLIIGADDDAIPAPNLYVSTGGGGYTEYEMPGDLYFGCLAGNWNSDGDSYWGEPNDGPGGADVDLVAEVHVGRCAADNATDVARFINKTLAYIGSSGTVLQNVQLVGEYLGFGGVGDWGGNYMNELVDGSSAHGYTTVGFPSDVFTIDKLYDMTWPGNDWPMSELVNRINTGRHIVNHLGHGSPDYAMKLYNSDVLSQLDNDDLFLAYSQTCQAGWFDGTDCWAETANIKTDNGAFAVIMNARYGFGEFESTDGPSQKFNREFWDAVFNPAEGKLQLGPANSDSKEDNLYRINEDCMRWCYYEINLFGDPTVGIKGVNSISFTYTGGAPVMLSPAAPVLLEVTVIGVGDGIPVENSGQLHYILNGGTMQTVAMTQMSANVYQGYLPAVTCDDDLQFYVSAEEVSQGRISEAPHHPRIATAQTTAFADNFETNLGWTISGGQWARGVPTGQGGEYGGPDPATGYNGPNVLGYNLNGDYIDNMPEYHVTSPAISCADIEDTHLKFQRWLGVEQPDYDHAYIRLSTNGTAWTTVWENSGTMYDGAWVEVDLDISGFADGQSTIYIRFTMGITDVGWTYCGWNIDDLSVYGYECTITAPYIATESIPDWTENVSISQQLLAAGGVGVKTWSDKNNDLVGTGLTLSSTGLLSGIPTAAGSISFTALVQDEAMQTAEKPFAFAISPAVEITTASLPDGIEGEPYSVQLGCTGGTGDIMWQDKNNALDGTGLTLTAVGLLSGTPVVVRALELTVDACDQVGDTAEVIYSLNIFPPYICGDVNDDEAVNVLDIAYLIDYKFKGGAAPVAMGSADVNHDGSVNILDITYMIAYKYQNGPEPDCEG